MHELFSLHVLLSGKSLRFPMWLFQHDRVLMSSRYHQVSSKCFKECPPNMTTNACSPCVSFHTHWIFFASLNRGWSQVMTGTCPGLRTATAFLITFIECRIIAIDFESSRKRERSALAATGACLVLNVCSVLVEW